MNNDKTSNKYLKERLKKVKPYQEINNEFFKNNRLKQKQPTLQPQYFEEFGY